MQTIARKRIRSTFCACSSIRHSLRYDSIVGRIVAVVLVVGCGPTVAADTSDGTSDGTSSTSLATTATSDGTASTTSTNASDAIDSSGTAVDCEASTPNCADGCTIVSAHFATWDDPHVGNIEHICVAEGPPVANYRSTWWAMIDGELRIITSTPECLFDHPPEQVPIEWTECAGTDDEPAACRYLCAHDVCPGEVDVATLRSCMVDEPCGDIGLPGPCDQGGVACLYTAMRDRTPGRYELSIGYPNSDVSWTLLIEPDGDVRATVIDEYEIFCAAGLWQPARTCSLVDPTYFDACMTTCGKDCLPETSALFGWLVDCVDEPAVCE